MQVLDELDDLIGVIGLMAERIRNTVIALAAVGIALAIEFGGILLAFRHPPLALGAAMLLFVILLYRSVTATGHAFSQSPASGHPARL